MHLAASKQWWPFSLKYRQEAEIYSQQFQGYWFHLTHCIVHDDTCFTHKIHHWLLITWPMKPQVWWDDDIKSFRKLAQKFNHTTVYHPSQRLQKPEMEYKINYLSGSYSIADRFTLYDYMFSYKMTQKRDFNDKQDRTFLVITFKPTIKVHPREFCFLSTWTSCPLISLPRNSSK